MPFISSVLKHIWLLMTLRHPGTGLPNTHASLTPLVLMYCATVALRDSLSTAPDAPEWYVLILGVISAFIFAHVVARWILSVEMMSAIMLVSMTTVGASLLAPARSLYFMIWAFVCMFAFMVSDRIRRNKHK